MKHSGKVQAALEAQVKAANDRGEDTITFKFYTGKEENK